MRTTVTLEPDVALLIKQEMSRSGIGFKEALNGAVRQGLQRQRARAGHRGFKTHSMGPPAIDLTHALRVAAAMDDEVILEKLRQGR